MGQPPEIEADDEQAANERSLATLIRAITLAQNQFTLIIVCCNYAQLRDRLVQQLLQACPVPIQTLTLPETAKTLLRPIQMAMAQPQTQEQQENLPPAPNVNPQCLFLFGLESLAALDKTLIATNIVREELRKQMPFPLVLWANDDVIRKLDRLAPDLYSWAGNSIIEFEIATSELVQSLKSHSDRLFNSILDNGDEQFLANWKITPTTNALRQSELPFALSDLRNRQYAIEPELQASLDFLLGQDAHSRGEMETAREYYQRSLDYWLMPAPAAAASTSAIPLHPSSLERAACVLFYLGLWWRSYAVLQRAAYIPACQQAYDYFRRSLLMFTEENRQDLVARFIIAESETLQKLERWTELEELARRSLVLHKLYKDPIRQARDHGFLAEAALARHAWNVAKQQVITALQILEDAEVTLHHDGHPPDPNLEANLDVAHRYHSGWYLLMLAQAEKALGNIDAAIYHLETARDHSHPQSDPPLFIRILRTLRDNYFDAGDYRAAFRTKQTRRLIEHQYGYRAFVGALRLQPPEIQPGTLYPLPPQIDPQALLTQEIAASGRQQDLKHLMDRLSLPKDKLIVIHGPSGVGKSSIVTAGLVPLLKEYWVGDRAALPILLEVYTDWHLTLDRKLSFALEEQGIAIQEEGKEDSQEDTNPAPALPLPTLPLPTLRRLLARNTLPILIFDQFEEFFFAYETVQSRRPFYTFLQDCLNLPFVKVVLSLREDYLHYLLELQRLTNLDIIDNDILSKEIRYPLGDFTPAEARTVIQSLTEKAQFYLPDDLIDELVQDLAGELDEVRPIELQVVGAQLQVEDINTLEEYRQKGPKERLVQRSLEDVVKDCGPENAELARLILFLLTNEKNTRPLKTRDDLEADLIDLGFITNAENLDLVLEVLVGSGLLFLIPEHPEDRYQIVHDYLVSFIRDQYKSGLVEELEREREQRKRAEEQLNIELRQRLATEEKLSRELEQRLQTEQERNIAVKQRLLWSGVAGVVLAWSAVMAASFWFVENQQRQRAELGEITSLGANAETLLALGRSSESLVESVRAGKQIQGKPWVDRQTRDRIQENLQLGIYGTAQLPRRVGSDKNRGAADQVMAVAFSSNGQQVATGFRDGTVRVGKLSGQQLSLFKGHQERLVSVALSPNGQQLATSGKDGTVRLWNGVGEPLSTFPGHQGDVELVVFSPDGSQFATVDEKDTIRLWDLAGNQRLQLKGQQRSINSLVFSPDGTQIATSSKNGAQIWTTSGKLIRTLKGHDGRVLKAVFSPNGQQIATSGRDGTVRLWDLFGKPLGIFEGRRGDIESIAFSPDGKQVVVFAADGTHLLEVSNQLFQLDFIPYKLQSDFLLMTSIRFSQDQKLLAIHSEDGTINFWPVESLDQLLVWSCKRLHDYLRHSPNVSEADRKLCDGVQ